MNQRSPFAVLFFLTGTVLGAVPPSVRLRFLLRRGFALSWFTAWLIRELSDSDVSHCAVALGEVVYDPCLAGDRTWPLDVFLRRFPGITDLFIIPSAGCALPSPRPCRKAWWPSLLRWMTRGAVAADDCVTCTAAVLRAAGHAVPADAVTPDDLRSWARQQGFKHERFVEV